MADFHTVLKRAIAALPDQSGPSRRAVYDKARKALLKQLQGLDPPLSAQEVTQQRLALEDAIRKVEADVARAARSPAGAAPQPAAPQAAPPSRPTPPAEPAEEEPEDAAPAERAPSAPRVPPRPSFPSAPASRAPAGEGSAPRPTAPRAPVAPSRPASPQRSAGPPRPEKADVAQEVPQRRREPGFGRPAPIPTPPQDEPVEAAAPEPEVTEAEDRAPAGRADPFRRVSQRDVEPLPPADDLTEEEIEEAAAEAEAPETPDVAPAADRRGWLRRRAGKGASKDAPQPVPAVYQETADDAEERDHDDDYAEDAYAEDGYDDEGYVDEDAYYDDEEPYYDDGQDEQRRRSSFRWLIAPLVIVIILAVGAFALYTQRDAIMAMMAPSSGGETSEPATPSSTAETDASDSNKISDRLNGGTSESDNAVVAPDARSVRTTRVVTPRNGDNAANNGESALPGTTPAPAPGASSGTGASETSPSSVQQDTTRAPAPAGNFEVVLYEEGGSAGQGGNALRGSVDWEFLEESIGGQSPEPVVRAKLAIPERDLIATMLFRKNNDSALPASHLIEISFELPSDFPGGAIANVPGLIMKQSESAQGNALLGASAQVSDNLFWIALSASPADEEKNLELLRDRSWIDIPLLYESGGRAILTVDKGPQGTEAINQALDAWAGP
ncbi:hypothetical protein [Amorphus sp. 3PC139-8]|uniref:hypothetical protein n=1 Tax=Amorphus sp. 3PC139-8 TaxID=2735676 RepID=UPI00345CFEAD